MRLFIATRIDEKTATRIADAFREVRSRIGRASWVPPHACHLTWAFLGDRDENEAGRVSDLLPRAVRALQPYDGAITGGGCFPNERRPRVGWLAFEQPDDLVKISEAVRHSLDQERIPYDEKAFKPHLTVVRVRQRWTAMDAREFLRACDDLGRVSVSLGRVSLFRSELLPEGAKHFEVAGADLREAPL